MPGLNIVPNKFMEKIAFNLANRFFQTLAIIFMQKGTNIIALNFLPKTSTP